jgi:hypothetical protein
MMNVAAIPVPEPVSGVAALGKVRACVCVCVCVLRHLDTVL